MPFERTSKPTRSTGIWPLWSGTARASYCRISSSCMNFTRADGRAILPRGVSGSSSSMIACAGYSLWRRPFFFGRTRAVFMTSHARCTGGLSWFRCSGAESQVHRRRRPGRVDKRCVRCVQAGGWEREASRHHVGSAEPTVGTDAQPYRDPPTVGAELAAAPDAAQQMSFGTSLRRAGETGSDQTVKNVSREKVESGVLGGGGHVIADGARKIISLSSSECRLLARGGIFDLGGSLSSAIGVENLS